MSDAPSLRESPKPRPFAPPFTKKAVGKHYVWADDLTVAYLFAKDYGLELTLSSAAYQVAKLTGDGVKLVIYPHTTRGTGNQHLRVRDEGSKDTRRAQALMTLLDRAAGYNCTFSFHWPVNRLAHAWSLSLHEPGMLDRVTAEAAPSNRNDGASPQTQPPNPTNPTVSGDSHDL